VAFLVAAVVLVGLLCLLDLLLTVGVIQRLRQHTELLNKLQAGAAGGPAPEVMLPAGSEVGEFAATTTDGDPVSRELLAGRTLVGFFSPGCQPCKEKLPGFVAAAPGVAGGRQQVLAVVVGGQEEDAEVTARLTPVARVVVEPPDGPVAGAFGATGFPAFALLDAHRVVASGWELEALPVPTKA
jgi:AhpC/TSA family protein